MDFVKREDQSVIDEENYKVYMDNVSIKMSDSRFVYKHFVTNKHTTLHPTVTKLSLDSTQRFLRSYVVDTREV